MLPIVFMSNEQGAPVLNNAAGSLISVLDACLVNGFNTVGIFSITITDNVATVVTSATHGLAVGNRVTIAGVSITAATGDKEVASVVNSTTFTFPCVNANNSESPVSATVKRTPLGWLKPFNKTNVGMYKPSVAQAYGQSLRIDDTGTNGAVGARVFAVENPTGIDAWSDKFPLESQYAGGGYWPKGTNTTAAKSWCIVGDERLFYILIENSAYTIGNFPGGTAPNQYWSYEVFFFGDVVSNKPGEAFGSVVGFRNGPGIGNNTGPRLTSHSALGTAPVSNSGFVLARQHTGVAKSVMACASYPGGRDPGSTSFPRYPSPIGNELNISEPVFVSEDLSYAVNPVRGIMPGLVAFLCNNTDLPRGPLPQKITTTDGSNKTYLYAPYCATVYPNSGSQSCFSVKLNESWR